MGYLCRVGARLAVAAAVTAAAAAVAAASPPPGGAAASARQYADTGDAAAAAAAPDLPIPTLTPGCPPPTFRGVFSRAAAGSRVGWLWTADVTVCGRWDGAGAFRFQAFTAPAGAVAPARRVGQSIERRAAGWGGVPSRWDGPALRRGCQPRSIYADACVVDGATATAVCDRSWRGTIEPLGPPGLSPEGGVYPLQALALALGDTPRLTARFTVSADGAGAEAPPPPAVRLVAVVRRADNTTRRSCAVTGTTTVVNELLAGGVTAADDGAVASVEVSRAACPAAGTTMVVNDGDLGGPTVLSVSAATPPLVAQDTAPPVLVRAVYPPTVFGEPVNLTAVATNGGGGRRRRLRGGGATMPTALTYQWYRLADTARPSGNAFVRTPLAGATRPVLALPAAECNSFALRCNRGGCTGLVQYQVDVCNTFACVRSGVLLPAILAPADAARAAALTASGECTFVD